MHLPRRLGGEDFHGAIIVARERRGDGGELRGGRRPSAVEDDDVGVPEQPRPPRRGRPQAPETRRVPLAQMSRDVQERSQHGTGHGLPVIRCCPGKFISLPGTTSLTEHHKEELSDAHFMITRCA